MKSKYNPGINHIEIWVRDLPNSLQFYKKLFSIIGWQQLSPHSFSCGIHEIYFKQSPCDFKDSLGVRHICFHAISRDVVNKVGRWLTDIGAEILRGPQAMPQYDSNYYTVDFKDPDGFILEVAHTPDLQM